MKPYKIVLILFQRFLDIGDIPILQKSRFDLMGQICKKVRGTDN